MSLRLLPKSNSEPHFKQWEADHFTSGNQVVLLVEDNEEKLTDFKTLLEQFGYLVVVTDNGQDAAKRARYLRPDLLLVDLDLPLLYELVAARQIVKQARIENVPVVIVTDEKEVDPYPMMDLGVRRNEYVTRLSEDDQLEHLLNFLLPIGPTLA